MSSDSSSPAKPSPASVSVQRYGRDLACLLKRLDEIEAHANEQQMLLSNLALLVSQINRESCARPQPVSRKREVVTQGNCRIIQFKAAQNQ